MLNTDLNIFSIALAAKLKSVLPSLTASQQTAYVQNRYNGYRGRLISGILDVSDKLNIDDYLVTAAIEKSFRLSRSWVFASSFEKNGFGNNFIDLIKVLLTDQKSCVINGGSATPYFISVKRARQSDLISAYLFIIALEIFFAMINSNPNTKFLLITT